MASAEVELQAKLAMIMGEAKAATASRVTALKTGPTAAPAARSAAGEVLVSRQPGYCCGLARNAGRAPQGAGRRRRHVIADGSVELAGSLLHRRRDRARTAVLDLDQTQP